MWKAKSLGMLIYFDRCNEEIVDAVEIKKLAEISLKTQQNLVIFIFYQSIRDVGSHDSTLYF